ncbi:replication restart helicase PriA [Desulfatirhabdium butyrativorans]|uniref:replication restart helicase PriA n=1 Tax=Desulfatirhabdium butyrativorans TaxID=340467 RepID=UPI0004296B85|nr:primosomal protein N' [Desulfatirhabdium butyrativorans]
MNDASRYEVAVALPVRGTFTYSGPPSAPCAPEIGMRVVVPFGRRPATGYILGPATDTREDILPIQAVVDTTPIFPPSLVPFFRWLSVYYLYPIGEVIQAGLPGCIDAGIAWYYHITEAGLQALAEGGLKENHRTALQALASGKTERSKRTAGMKGRAGSKGVSAAVLNGLIRKGYALREYRLEKDRVRHLTETVVRLSSDHAPGTDGASSPELHKIMETVARYGEMPLRMLKKEAAGATPARIRKLVDQRWLELDKRIVYRDPFGEMIDPEPLPNLTEEQRIATRMLSAAIGNGYEGFLLNGVTGSGKTEVYLHACRMAVAKNMDVLVLVPEIALISQIERAFRARFGNRIAVIHSGLSEGKRFDEWHRILHKEVHIVIGTRSAIFAPLERIGLIIVDEEHDTSFKQESGLRYHARDMAMVRAKLCNAVVLLGSATPSIQSFYNLSIGKLRQIRMQNRVEDRPLPAIEVVDLSVRRDTRGTERFITPELHQAMVETLDRGEQVLLFLNRRGFAALPVCAHCGLVLRCRNCDISLTYHQQEDTYRCHYCGYAIDGSSPCPACGSPKIKRLGIGTEKVEATVKGLFPAARLARMDRDAIRGKHTLLNLLKDLRNRKIDILIGTQMVTKGHDFPYITLVGILLADQSLHFPDFRAAERTFQIISQVAGRAGRGEQPGRVIVQTYTPRHFSVVSAIAGDYEGFYWKEISYRKRLSYPPFSSMAQMLVHSKDPRRAKDHAEALGQILHHNRTSAEMRQILVMGPIQAFVAKLINQHRWQLLLKSKNRRALHDFLERTMFENPGMFHPKQIGVAIDIDPVFMM